MRLFRVSPVDLAGRTIVVVGADSCVGAEMVRRLVRAHATVVLACARFEPAAQVMSEVMSRRPHADLFYERLLDEPAVEVRERGRRMLARYARLHGVVLVATGTLAGAVTEGWMAAQRSHYSLTRSLASGATLSRVVVATSMERASGTTPQRVAERRALAQCGRSNLVFARALSRLLPERIVVSASCPSIALAEGGRSEEAREEAEAAFSALVQRRARVDRPWCVHRGWLGARVGVTRSSAPGVSVAAHRLGAWLQSETGIGALAG